MPRSIKSNYGSSLRSFLTYNSHHQQWLSPLQTSARCVSPPRIPNSHTTNSFLITDHVSPVSSLDPSGVARWSSSFPSFAIILPPLGVFLERGCGADLLINILLVRLSLHSSLPGSANVPFSDSLGLHVRLRSRFVFTPSLHRSSPASPGIIHGAAFTLIHPTAPDPDHFSPNSPLHHPQVLGWYASMISLSILPVGAFGLLPTSFHDPLRSNGRESSFAITVFLPPEMAP